MGRRTLISAAIAVALLVAILISLESPDGEVLPPSPPPTISNVPPPPEIPDPPLAPVQPVEAPVPEEAVAPEDEAGHATEVPEASKDRLEILKQLLEVKIPERETARVEVDPVTEKPIEATPGQPPRVEVGRLVEDGLASLSGAIEITGDRKPVLEEGMPVGLTGRVIEKETGHPVPRASVVVRSAFYTRVHFYDHHLREVARVTTDEDGGFLIDRLNVESVHFGKGGLVYLSVESPDHAPLLAMPLSGVTSGYRNRLPVLTLSRERYTVRGKVVDLWEGKPVAGGRVVATGEIQPINYPKDQREALFLSAPAATTGEDGAFLLENVGPGKQMISVHGGNDCAGYLPITVPVKGEIVIQTRQLRGRIEGTVRDDRDRPVPLVRIDGGENTTHTFADGTFALENFRGDVVTLALSHPDYRPLSRPGVQDGTRELILGLVSRWPEVYFRVRDHKTNHPLKKIEVRLEAAEGAEVPPLPASPFYVSKKGRHAVRVPAGYTSATVTAKGYEERKLDLSQAAPNDVIEIVLRRMGQ